ncbi:phospholipase A2 inhibitor gamma subunit A-like [Anomaloglossus baeobatrachus]|uniref:phospholipase A2 inhibitor gamma subunit A-like n=1 Tax=Anomaloglossus baeobatrachus TaxID=238106 RepID=UPI003F506315
MKPVIISIFLLCLSLHIAAALKCYQCHERDSDTCEHEEIECPEGDKCLTVCEKATNGKTFHSLYKNCSSNIPCDVNIDAWANDEHGFAVSTKCCDEEDLCNVQMYEMPEEEEPSGFMCPSCFEYDTLKECTANEEIRCHRKDDKCVSVADTVEYPDGLIVNNSAKGCMSAMACLMDPTQMIGVKILHQEFSICTDPPEVLNGQGNEENE